VLVATDYFTKWTEVVALKNMTHKEVIEFITEHIIHRFGIPQTLTTDQGTSFMSKEVREFAELYRIKLLNSSPYYAQANGQAESSNRTLINLIKKKISDNPKHWHKILSEAYGLIEYLNIVLLKCLLLSLSMGRKQCCMWK
jgi:transposase InsO family protein